MVAKLEKERQEYLRILSPENRIRLSFPAHNSELSLSTHLKSLHYLLAWSKLPCVSAQPGEFLMRNNPNCNKWKPNQWTAAVIFRICSFLSCRIGTEKCPAEDEIFVAVDTTSKYTTLEYSGSSTFRSVRDLGRCTTSLIYSPFPSPPLSLLSFKWQPRSSRQCQISGLEYWKISFQEQITLCGGLLFDELRLGKVTLVYL